MDGVDIIDIIDRSGTRDYAILELAMPKKVGLYCRRNLRLQS